MNCRHCGKPVPEDFVFCPFCGKKIESHLRAEDAYEDMDEYGYEETEDRAERRAERKAERKERRKKRIKALLTILAAIVFVAAAFIIVLKVAKPYLGEEPWGDEDQSVQTEDGLDQLQEVKTMYVSAEDGLILRSGPGDDSESVHILNHGQEVKVEKSENGWAYVTAEGVSGWCSEEYLTEDQAEAAKKEAAPASDEDKGKLVEPSVLVDSGQHWTVDSEGGLNLRCGPGQDYDIILVVPDKTEIAEEGRSGDWIFVKYEGQYGWINIGYIKPKA